jgi:selenocysteine lyase/cysteine desulfurase
MDVEALRAETPGCAHRLHLNNAGAALMARPTLDAMTGHLRLEAEIGGYEAAVAAQDAIGAAYAGIAGLLGGAPMRWRCSTTLRMPGTPRSTPCRWARATGS